MFNEIHDPAARVRTIGAYARDLTAIDLSIPIIKYYRSGKEMLRMAKVYEEEGSLEEAFIIYSKYITLFVEMLPKHTNYKSFSSDEKIKNTQSLKQVFPKAEALKKKLLIIFSKEDDLRKLKQKEIDNQMAVSFEQKRKEVESEVALESERRHLQEEEEMKALEKRLSLLKTEKLSKFGNKLDTSQTLSLDLTNEDNRNPDSTNMNEEFSHNNFKLDRNNSLQPSIINNSSVNESIIYVPIPNRSLKPSYTFEKDQKPTVDRSGKPTTLACHHFTNVGEKGLKTLFLPKNVTESFLNRIQLNTEKSIETCAMLAGKLQKGSWFITHLIIPNQHGTSDSCDIDNDEDVAQYQDVNNLITLGWIHTHPSQTAFLSSVDQHTHWPYQKLLPEAIAIVCAPKYNEIGYFNLSQEFGMDFVQNCRGTGFHEHPQHPPIFETCSHMKFDELLSTIVIDLRRKIY